MLEQSTTRSAVVASAAQVASVAARHADAAEQARKPHPEVIDAVLAGGFARHFVPRDAGGAEGTFQELVTAVGIVGESCAATAWCASIAANLARMVAYLPAEGYQQIWAAGPDTLVVGSLSPTGRAEPAPGGWRLSGRWQYISAIDYADWVLVCAVTPAGGDGARPGPPPARVFAVPRTHLLIADTWDNVGMRGTGSNTAVVEDVFVPAAHSFERAALFTGATAESKAACHTVPLQAVNGLSFAAPGLGAARGGLASWTAYVSQKLGTLKPGGPGLSRSAYQSTLARSAGEIDAAGLLLERVAVVADRGAGLEQPLVARNLRDCSLSIDLMVSAMDRLFRAAGTTGQSAQSPFQRFWRDVNCVGGHASLQFEPAAIAYAETVLH